MLVLWDIDRTLLFAGDVDQMTYNDVFKQLFGHSPEFLPERGTGITTPRVVKAFLERNGVPAEDVPELARRALDLIPEFFSARRERLKSVGWLMPGAREALAAVRAMPEVVPTVVTGNLKATALIKLEAFGLEGYLDTDLGGYASDDDFRPNLVGIARRRAGLRHGVGFSAANTVLIGDSLEDVTTAKVGGGRLIAVATGTTSRETLSAAGVDVLFDTLLDTDAVVAAVRMLGAG